MGCIKKIFNAIILALAVVGFISIGGKDFVVDMYNNYVRPYFSDTEKEVSKIADLTDVSDEYEIDRTANAMGYNGILAEHKGSGQKLIIIDCAQKPILTVEDFKNNTVDEKLNEHIKKFKYKSIIIDDFQTGKRGTIQIYGKSAPYVRFTANIKKLPIGTIAGMIGAVENGENQSRLMISLNQKNKYSQIISDEFFKNVR